MPKISGSTIWQFSGKFQSKTADPYKQYWALYVIWGYKVPRPSFIFQKNWRLYRFSIFRCKGFCFTYDVHFNHAIFAHFGCLFEGGAYSKHYGTELHNFFWWVQHWFIIDWFFIDWFFLFKKRVKVISMQPSYNTLYPWGLTNVGLFLRFSISHQLIQIIIDIRD